MELVAVCDRLAERLPDLKVIYMSGYNDDVVAHHGVLEEGIDLIQKPVSTGVLAARVRELWRALALPDDGQVIVVAGDGFASEPVPTETLCCGVLLHTLDGVPLPAAKGGPFRLLIPERAGAPLGACANVKGVAKLVLR